MEKENLLVICGGESSEHGVSLISASSVLSNLSQEKYDITVAVITKKGEWFLYSGPYSSLKGFDADSLKGNSPSVYLKREEDGVYLLGDGVRVRVSVVFPVLHGRNGEDGKLQGMLEMLGVDYVGCDTASSANCMDKELTHIILAFGGIKMARWIALSRAQCFEKASISLCERELGYPVFVKPASEGSSVGVSKARNAAELEVALNDAAKCGNKVLVEEYVKGREIECAVLGNESPIASVVGEIGLNTEFYDYEAKYVKNCTELFIPARIDEGIAQRVRDLAVAAYKRMGCSGLARVDFFVCDNDIILNEINTLPGFTSISMYPKLFAASGIEYSQLLERLIELAKRRDQ